MEILNKIIEIKEKALNGEEDILLSYCELKNIQKQIADALDEVNKSAIKEAEKFPEKTFEYKGYKFTKNEGRAIYNFKNVKLWSETQSKLKEIEELSKASAQHLQRFKTMMVTEDGEQVEPCEITYSQPSLIVK